MSLADAPGNRENQLRPGSQDGESDSRIFRDAPTVGDLDVARQVEQAGGRTKALLYLRTPTGASPAVAGDLVDVLCGPGLQVFVLMVAASVTDEIRSLLRTEYRQPRGQPRVRAEVRYAGIRLRAVLDRLNNAGYAPDGQVVPDRRGAQMNALQHHGPFATAFCWLPDASGGIIARWRLRRLLAPAGVAPSQQYLHTSPHSSASSRGWRRLRILPWSD